MGRNDRVERERDAGRRPGGESVARYLRVAYAVVHKDFVLELRSKRILPLSVALSLLIVTAFAFSMGAGADGQGALLIAFVFAGMLGVMQSITVETQDRAFDGVIMAPVPLTAVYVGKVISNTVFVTVIGVVTLGATAVFLHSAPALETASAALAVITAFSFGFSAIAVTIAIITALTGISALLLPVLLVPLLVPALLATAELLSGGGGVWITVLLCYDGIVFVVGLLVFDELVV